MVKYAREAGYTFPLPIVQEAMRVAAVVYRLGWSGARELLDLRWDVQKAQLMANLIAVILDHEDALRESGRSSQLLRALGAR